MWQGKLTHVGKLRSYTAHGVREESTTASESFLCFRRNNACANGRHTLVAVAFCEKVCIPLSQE